MSHLRIFSEHDGNTPILSTGEHAVIARELGKVGVRFERWQANAQVTPGAGADEVIAAYRRDIDRLMQENGYRAVDIVSLKPDHPDRASLRQKFLEEHTHAEDEVRFFVAGQGLFTLHIKDKVYDILCRQGDLIGVPANTPHWFDMGDQPYFIAIRLFTNPSGWVANFTGDAIAQRFPRFAA